MTSCGGTFSVTVRRSTLTILSTTGISRNRPGPFGGDFSRPSRKITPRSYSRATLTAAKRTISSRMATARTAIPAAATGAPFRGRRKLTPGGSGQRRRRFGGRRNTEHELVVDRLDPHRLAGGDALPLGSRAPELAVHEDGAFRVERP